MTHRRVALVCPTAFKGTLSAAVVAEAMAAGVAQADPTLTVVSRPLSDGGNGLLDALSAPRPGASRFETVTVAGPLDTPVEARFLRVAATPPYAAVETAEACGLHLVPADRRDPLRTGTRGVGELLRAAAAAGDPVVIGLGGSATVDAGAGMVTALGWRLLDDRGRPLPPGGGALHRLDRIESPAPSPRPPATTVLADVTNPLLGPRGAARVFGPQKGADAAGVRALERGLERWAAVVERDLGVAVADLDGAGAAGGLGAAFAAFLSAPPVRGADWVLDAIGFDPLLADASLVITGEGAWDAQSAMGKVTGVVVDRARAAGRVVALIAGSISDGVPPGVTAADGGGGSLDAGGVTAVTRRVVAGLLGSPAAP